MIEHESDFQSKFSPWIEEQRITCGYELKISHNKRLCFSAFQEQQLPSLYKIKHAAKNIKLSDALKNLKPCDGVCLAGQPAYVGVMFNIPNNQKEFYLIDIDEVMAIRKLRKSITEEECDKLGHKYSF